MVDVIKVYVRCQRCGWLYYDGDRCRRCEKVNFDERMEKYGFYKVEDMGGLRVYGNPDWYGQDIEVIFDDRDLKVRRYDGRDVFLGTGPIAREFWTMIWEEFSDVR